MLMIRILKFQDIYSIRDKLQAFSRENKYSNKYRNFSVNSIEAKQ